MISVVDVETGDIVAVETGRGVDVTSAPGTGVGVERIGARDEHPTRNTSIRVFANRSFCIIITEQPEYGVKPSEV